MTQANLIRSKKSNMFTKICHIRRWIECHQKKSRNEMSNMLHTNKYQFIIKNPK